MNCLILALLLLCGGNSCGNHVSNSESCCSCRPDYRPEPRFEQRAFVFGQNTGCGREEASNNNCGGNNNCNNSCNTCEC